ncbi:MAG: bifunctional 5,10-methylenetetrahydrofolate dehydrogenase/5,10-methenyltetrahydrofolate cyclohydrolase, partial [Spirochaeta sp.]|nr:bifunctional 5,10-methylenetetrahydrofolate dehydrogenase/5,10-methenyltetrahydrofolate cyclohydrolase [Spirochaeta sp.]
LPKHIDSGKVIATINPAKDVDGFHPVSMGNMLLGLPGFIPCTPHGVLVMLEKSGVQTEGAEVVVLGRSNIVGKPLASLLSQKRPSGNATVTVCHTRTKNLAEHTRRADILIAAAGSPGMVTGDMIKPGAVVIDVGVNRVDAPETTKGYRLQGDVLYEEVSQVASAITPVPGGVGPMTITMLLLNTVESAERV